MSSKLNIPSIFRISRLIIFIFFIIVEIIEAQDSNVVLTQGTLSGLKVFPESSRTPVYAFLGIPYAQPPVDNLRFAPPVPHPGWNTTLIARDFQSVCPQLDNNPYEDTKNTFNPLMSKTSEDCLYLNIWTPENGLRFGNLPVLVIITGEDMAFDWVQNRPTGLDIASEGIVVVTIQYRTNIFGWLGLQHETAPGNLGLLDQHLALLWIKENIHKFGGEAKRITLLGHGTTAASNAMIHLVSPKARNLFSKLVIMSGTVFSSYSFQLKNTSPSTEIVKTLQCEASEVRFVLACLRHKSISDLLKAFEKVYKNGNYTNVLGPVVDNFLSPNKRYLTDDPRKLIATKQYHHVPIMIGICNNEGAFIRDSWIDYAKQGPRSLRKFIDETVISNILQHYSFTDLGQTQVRETIEWRFFDQIPKSSAYLIDALQKIISETKFELPFFETIEVLAGRNGSDNQDNVSSSITVKNTNFIPQSPRDSDGINADRNVNEIDETNKKKDLFVYSFQKSINAMDMRGRINYFGGASHSSDLPFLMGPSLFQQIGRRRLSQSEVKLCKKIRQLFGDFVKTGNPTPGRIFDSWKPYTVKKKYIKILSTRNENIPLGSDSSDATNLHKNLPMLEHLFDPDTSQDTSSPWNPYQLSNNVPNDRELGSKNSEYLGDGVNLQYYFHLNNVYSFWNKLLPKIYKNLQYHQLENAMKDKDKDEVQFLENTSYKFKHAFFSMLTLVCLLLAILCVCVYILKKNHKNIDTSVL